MISRGISMAIVEDILTSFSIRLSHTILHYVIHIVYFCFKLTTGGHSKDLEVVASRRSSAESNRTS